MGRSRTYIVTLLAVLLSLPAFGGEARRVGFSFVRKHEFAAGVAFYPGRYSFGYDYASAGYSYTSPSISYIYSSTGAYYKERITDTWTVSYAYNFSRIWAIQASLSYEGGWIDYYGRSDGAKVSRISTNLFTPMVYARAAWLNRGYFRAYSVVGLGVSFSLTDTAFEVGGVPYTRPKQYFSFQVTPVGISVGNRLFGFVEVGVGTIYAGGCMGIGYRF